MENVQMDVHNPEGHLVEDLNVCIACKEGKTLLKNTEKDRGKNSTDVMAKKLARNLKAFSIYLFTYLFALCL